MGDILSKLQMVSEKIGVTETAHTIEEQVDLISESLDKIPASTNIAEALDDLSEVAQNINNEEVYVDKTITENGEYLPASDEATAYSKVVVDVQNNIKMIEFPIPIIVSGTGPQLSNITPQNSIYKTGIILFSDDGIYDLESLSYRKVTVLSGLTKKISNAYPDKEPTGQYSYAIILFTPSEDWDGIYNGTKIISTASSAVTPGDGKWYAYVPAWNGQNVSGSNKVYKMGNTDPFKVSIT